MTEVISRAEVREVARLARLTLSDAEVAEMQRALASILAYVKKLDELEVGDVPPTAHPVELPATLRPDVARPGLPVDAALANAPERLGDGFGVPKIIE